MTTTQTVEPAPAAPARTRVRAWTAVCRYAALLPGKGVEVVAGGARIAVFRHDDGELYAIGNVDPFSGAATLHRGLTGGRDGVPTVTSPVHRNLFDLRTGVCLDDAAVALPVYPTRRYRGLVWVNRTPLD